MGEKEYLRELEFIRNSEENERERKAKQRVEAEKLIKNKSVDSAWSFTKAMREYSEHYYSFEVDILANYLIDNKHENYVEEFGRAFGNRLHKQEIKKIIAMIKNDKELVKEFKKAIKDKIRDVKEVEAGRKEVQKRQQKRLEQIRKEPSVDLTKELKKPEPEATWDYEEPTIEKTKVKPRKETEILEELKEGEFVSRTKEKEEVVEEEQAHEKNVAKKPIPEELEIEDREEPVPAPGKKSAVALPIPQKEAVQTGLTAAELEKKIQFLISVKWLPKIAYTNVFGQEIGSELSFEDCIKDIKHNRGAIERIIEGRAKQTKNDFDDRKFNKDRISGDLDFLRTVMKAEVDLTDTKVNVNTLLGGSDMVTVDKMLSDMQTRISVIGKDKTMIVCPTNKPVKVLNGKDWKEEGKFKEVKAEGYIDKLITVIEQERAKKIAKCKAPC